MTSRKERLVEGLIDQRRATSVENLEYVLILPVWGDHHTTMLLRYCIPFLFTDGNIGAFPDQGLRVEIASRRVDFDRMRLDPNYQALARATRLRETEIDDLIDLSVPHRAMTECYLHVIRRLARPRDTVTILPTPDCILSRNALKRIVELIERGWRAVMVCGLRVTLETGGPILERLIAASPEGAGAVCERELVSVVLDHLHPISLTCDVRSDQFLTNWPSHVYWIAPDRSWLLAHCFHMHPLAVRGVPGKIDIHTTIDGDYLTELGAGPDELYICADSDELFCVELSPQSKRILGTLGSLTRRELLRFSVGYCNPLHRAFFPTAIHWRTSEATTVPADVTRQAEEFKVAVKRGSKIEELRRALEKTVRARPFLLLPGRFAWRSAQFAMRVVRHILRRSLSIARQVFGKRSAAP
jgi:hypothetical protein